MTNPDLPSLPGSPKELEGPEKAMLKLAYGVHVIGSRSASGEMNAMLADWVMQVSFMPRLVVAAIENDARTLRFIRETNVFSVNLLHQKDGREIARQVVMPSEARKVKGRPDEMQSLIVEKLANIPYGVHENGCPVLDQSLGWFTCDAEEFVPAGDHTLVIGRVTDGDVVREGEMLTERELGWEYAG
ncbi:MAG: flavin reductase family protein [Dehalococcoidia bacterium]|nr:flavin reductase family protein [Dehalococcoidia bacterium]